MGRTARTKGLEWVIFEQYYYYYLEEPVTGEFKLVSRLAASSPMLGHCQRYRSDACHLTGSRGSVSLSTNGPREMGEKNMEI